MKDKKEKERKEDEEWEEGRWGWASVRGQREHP